MPTIHSLIHPECVLIRPEAHDKNGVIRLLIDALYSAGMAEDPDRLFRDVLAREALGPTGIGSGCAIPHAHSPAVECTAVAAAVLADGIDFEAPDGEPAKLVFLLAGPEKHAGLHLKLLSKMARLLHDSRLIESLSEAESSEAFLSLLQNREE